MSEQAQTTIERPAFVTDEHLEYLDELRESGDINMWGAPAYVEREFGVTSKEASEITSYWMRTFGKETR